jgi:hypothetical protein
MHVKHQSQTAPAQKGGMKRGEFLAQAPLAKGGLMVCWVTQATCNAGISHAGISSQSKGYVHGTEVLQVMQVLQEMQRGEILAQAP